MSDIIGENIRGRYHVVELLERRNTVHVYKAFDIVDKRYVTVQIFLGTAFSQDETDKFSSRIVKEVKFFSV